MYNNISKHFQESLFKTKILHATLILLRSIFELILFPWFYKHKLHHISVHGTARLRIGVEKLLNYALQVPWTQCRTKGLERVY